MIPPLIYVVEDEALNALLLKTQLKKMGYEVARLFSVGEEVVDACQRNLPDLLLMDIHLSGKLDGIETVNKIFRRAKVPVIFITGYSDDEVKERALALEPEAYLVKPVTMDKIKTAVLNLFKV